MQVKEVSYCRYSPHNTLDDVFNDVVGIMCDFILSDTAMHHSAFVTRSHSEISLQEALNYSSCISCCTCHEHNVIAIVNIKFWFLVQDRVVVRFFGTS